MVDFDKFKKNLGIFGKAAGKTAVKGAANGLYRVGERACIVGKEAVTLAKAVHDKDVEKQNKAAEKIVDEVAVKTVKGFVALGKQACKTASDAKDYMFEKNPELKDRKLLNTVVGLGTMAGVAASAIMIGDAISEASPIDTTALDIVDTSMFLPDVDPDSVFGIDNHVVGMNADIQELSDLGMKSELVDNHIDSDSIIRSDAAKMDFLHSLNLSSVPDGFEVHHVVPLCQGGLDIPDNMVLISESDHDFITAQHRAFYNW